MLSSKNFFLSGVPVFMHVMIPNFAIISQSQIALESLGSITFSLEFKTKTDIVYHIIISLFCKRSKHLKTSNNGLAIISHKKKPD